MLILPQTTEYALRAVFQLASRHPDAVPVATLATAVGAPTNYLSKTLGRLVHAGLLTSSRGPTGGFRLVNAPEQVTLQSIVQVFSPRGTGRCLLGGGRCGENPHCPVHTRWSHVSEDVDSFFRSTTLADFAPSFATGQPFPTGP